VPTYGQLCPVAKSAGILTERWTPLIVRELLMGSRHFNEIQQGMPRAPRHPALKFVVVHVRRLPAYRTRRSRITPRA
jgi:hypothetical protein